MKQMVYQSSSKIELLDSGICFGYNYYILNLGTHPTAYVEIPKNNKYYFKDYDEIDIDVHGGLTYSKNYLRLGNQKIINGWFIGWDYAHFDDFTGYELNFPIEFRMCGKKWTTEEIQADVYSVCQQLKVVK